MHSERMCSRTHAMSTTDMQAAVAVAAAAKVLRVRSSQGHRMQKSVFFRTQQKWRDKHIHTAAEKNNNTLHVNAQTIA